jgi:hypothetical protein
MKNRIFTKSKVQYLVCTNLLEDNTYILKKISSKENINIKVKKEELESDFTPLIKKVS